MRRLAFLSASLLATAACSAAHAGSGSQTTPNADASTVSIPTEVDQMLATHCFSCHDGDSEKGDIRLDNLADLTLAEQLDLLNKVHEQLYIREMPPPDEETRPNPGERDSLISWLTGELRARDAARLDDKLRYPDYGNYVDHDTLFSGEIDEAPWSPARRWLVSPQIFESRVRDVFRLEGRDRQRQLYGITNPFMLPDRSGVRDYDHSTLDGGHLLVMLSNAEWISSKLIHAARVKSGEFAAGELPDPKDNWVPATDPAFEAVILNESFPPDEQLVAAIQEQFSRVLDRPADADEVEKYLALTRSSIELAGNAEGLRQMLVSVLLESDFLYRLEFGAGDADEHGRRPLAPHEAASAISYALGDRGPDPILREAATEGRLATAADYRREVERLLADDAIYAGPVDPAISGKNMRSHETSHPKLVRFFREFFGYPAAARVFKDIERSDGYYQNPSRGTLGTPGFLIKEADRIVDWHLQRDQDVFESLLTSDDYFVYHDKDNETGQAIIDEWRAVWERLGATDWETEPEKVIAEHREFLESKKSLRFLGGGRESYEFLRHMYFWKESFGRGRTPFTTPSFAHGYYYNHAPFYNLPPTPGAFRYGQRGAEGFKHLDDTAFWDYPVEQPFAMPHRHGLLTHPAWLIAHSSNFHTDPIKRGRWIREKLLAGSIPDIPITVDAQVPEDHHKTLRERVESVTHAAECWRCHERMNPLGMAFEAYDDFGRFRLDEPLEHEEHLIAAATKKDGSPTYATKPVDTSGSLDGTGDAELDGEVDGALDMIDRLAQSDRVRQSIIRHAFRFFMGRNEVLSDSRTLVDADRAYLDSGGSFEAVVVSLLTSDSFIYRKSSADL